MLQHLRHFFSRYTEVASINLTEEIYFLKLIIPKSKVIITLYNTLFLRKLDKIRIAFLFNLRLRFLEMVFFFGMVIAICYRDILLGKKLWLILHQKKS